MANAERQAPKRAGPGQRLNLSPTSGPTESITTAHADHDSHALTLVRAVPPVGLEPTLGGF